VERGPALDERDLLEHHGRLAPRLAQLGAAQPSQVPPAEQDAARIGVQQADGAAQERGLAAAVGAEHGHHLAGRHRQVDSVQHLGPGRVEALAQPLDAQRRLRGDPGAGVEPVG
jgi:hypothetical protein